MKARQTSSPRPKTPKPFRALLLSLAVLGLALLVAAGSTALWFAHRLHQFDRLRIDTAAEYDRLNRAHPFTPPPPSAAGVEPARVEAYLHAREALVSAITPGMEARARGLLERDALDEIHLLWALQGSYDGLAAVTRAHLDALRRESISPGEYRWIHGLAMREAFEPEGSAPEGAAREGAAYDEALRRVQILAKASPGSRASDMTADSFKLGLRERYASYGPLRSPVLARMGPSGSAAMLIDIVTAYYEPTRADGAASEKIHPEPPGARPKGDVSEGARHSPAG